MLVVVGSSVIYHVIGSSLLAIVCPPPRGLIPPGLEIPIKYSVSTSGGTAVHQFRASCLSSVLLVELELVQAVLGDLRFYIFPLPLTVAPMLL